MIGEGPPTPECISPQYVLVGNADREVRVFTMKRAEQLASVGTENISILLENG